MYTILGTIGAVLVLYGFYRTSIGKWKSKSFWYELDNAVGAILLIIYQAHLHAYAAVVLNFVWAVVAIKGLNSLAERYQSRKKQAISPARRRR
jgi:hypothetical protein